MDPDRLEWRVLGPLEVLDHLGAAVDVGGAQRRALLAQLILVPGRTVSVDALCDGIWGDRLPSSAVKSVQVHVSRLRRILPPDALRTRPPGYVLDVAVEDTDLGRFRADAAEGRGLLAGGLAAEAAAILGRALERWRGPALADVATYPFAAGAVAQLEEARLAATEDRIQAELELGRHLVLVSELEALVRAHPWREPLWGHLMVALHRSGRHADALAAYQRLRHQLLEELGLDPGPELQRLEREVLEQSPTLDLAAAGAASSGSTPARTMARSARSYTLRTRGPVVGRIDALSRLAAGRAAVSETGGAATVAITGEEGMGKTEVVAAFVEQLADDTVVVAGRCREELVVPYGPWIELLRQLDLHAELELIQGIDPETEAPERRRARLFEGVVEGLRDQASAAPLVLVVDDLHWADDATVSLLLHVIEAVIDDPVLVILAWRQHEVAAGHPVTRLVHHLARHDGETIVLDPLASADVAELLASTRPGEDPQRIEQVAERLHEVTDGVALFVTEAITALAARHAHLPDPGDVAIDVPETVRTLIARRLTTVGREATAVAGACAVLTDPFEPTVVSALTPELEHRQVLAAMDDLVDVGVLLEEPGGHTFVHAAFRDAVLADLRTGHRRMLHAAAYDTLVGQAGPSQLVRHAEEASGLIDDAQVYAQLVAAGHDAVSRGAFVDAASLFERAVDRAEPGLRPATVVALADARWRAGDISGAKAAAVEVTDRAGDPTIDDTTLADAVVLHATFGTIHGQDRVTLAAGDRSLEVITDADQRTRVAAVLAYHRSMWGATTAEAQTALDRARRSQRPDCSSVAAAEVCWAECMSLLGSPDLARRFETAKELLALGRHAGSLRYVGRALRVRALTEMSAGRLDALDRTLDELVDVAARIGSWLYQIDSVRFRTAGQLARGRSDDVLASLQNLQQTADRSQLAGRLNIGAQWFLMHWDNGDTRRCLAYLEPMRQSLPAESRLTPDRRVIDLIRLQVLADDGERDQAHQELMAMAPWADLDLAPCRNHASELVLVAGLLADLCVAAPAPELVPRLEPFRGQFAVLSWGECMLGSFDRYLAGLHSLIDDEVDRSGFEAAIALEEHAGMVTAARRTRAALQRAEDRWGTT